MQLIQDNLILYLCHLIPYMPPTKNIIWILRNEKTRSYSYPNKPTQRLSTMSDIRCIKFLPWISFHIVKLRFKQAQTSFCCTITLRATSAKKKERKVLVYCLLQVIKELLGRTDIPPPPSLLHIELLVFEKLEVNMNYCISYN